MAASKGNQYYLLRSKDGRDKKYTPETFIVACNEYFTFCLKNPFKTDKVFQHSGKIVRTHEKKARFFSIKGLCNWLDISTATFYAYEVDKDFVSIIARVKQIIETNQLELAAADLVNHNIVARLQSLKESTDVTTNGKDLPTPIIQVAPNDFNFAAREEDVS